MNITHQQYIITIEGTRSLTKAAACLGITQSALSKWLDKLEDELGTRLVIRGRSGLSLTRQGEAYLKGARKMLEIHSRASKEIQQAAGKSPKILTVAGTPFGGASLFSRMFPSFTSAFPDITLRFLEGYNKKAMELVRENKADLAIGSLMGEAPEDMDVTLLNERELILLVPEGYPYYYDAHKLKRTDKFPSITLSQIKSLSFVMPSPEVSFHDTLKLMFRQAGYEPWTVYESSNTRAICEMIQNGNGIGFISRDFFNPDLPVAPYSLDPAVLYHGALFCRKEEASEPVRTAVRICQQLEGSR